MRWYKIVLRRFKSIWLLPRWICQARTPQLPLDSVWSLSWLLFYRPGRENFEQGRTSVLPVLAEEQSQQQKRIAGALGWSQTVALNKFGTKDFAKKNYLRSHFKQKCYFHFLIHWWQAGAGNGWPPWLKSFLQCLACNCKNECKHCSKGFLIINKCWFLNERHCICTWKLPQPPHMLSCSLAFFQLCLS